jgi:hypothetical protein
MKRERGRASSVILQILFILSAIRTDSFSLAHLQDNASTMCFHRKTP